VQMVVKKGIGSHRGNLVADYTQYGRWISAPGPSHCIGQIACPFVSSSPNAKCTLSQLILSPYSASFLLSLAYVKLRAVESVPYGTR